MSFAIDILRPFVWRWRTELAIAGAFLAVLVSPFLLRPADTTSPSRYDRRLVIMTPHPDQIREEFGRAFARYWKETKGETLSIDWRVAGTSDLNTLIKSDFRSAFQHYWSGSLGQPNASDAAATFLNPKAAPGSQPRAEFLKSNVGIGVDLFFGGGPHDFQSHAAAGTLVAADVKTGSGLAAIRARHPEWFGEKGIPEVVSGQAFRDKDMRWCGTCLSSFGIVFNRDVLQRLGITKDPATWEDLADPRLLGQVALADPSKSGSATQAFEMIVQQQMQLAVARFKARPGHLRKPADIEAAGVREGWLEGLRLIQSISGNARYFADASPKTPLDVSRGDAAAGMCIDFYGRSGEESVRRPDGCSRIGFVAPLGGTTLTVDPIGLMRGAPEPQLAESFMEFVLSERGQKLWDFRAGTPGGPGRTPLRRLPIRKDFYTAENLAQMSDPGEEPFLKAQSFIYHPEWTSGLFDSLRFIIRIICVDTHDELQETWTTLARQHNPPRASEVFHQLALVDYDAARGDINRILTSKDKVLQVREARRLTDAFRHQYRQALVFARAEK